MMKTKVDPVFVATAIGTGAVCVTSYHGRKAKIFYVSGGSLTRVDVRERDGSLVVDHSGNHVHAHDAIAAYAAAVDWMQDEGMEQ